MRVVAVDVEQRLVLLDLGAVLLADRRGAADLPVVVDDEFVFDLAAARDAFLDQIGMAESSDDAFVGPVAVTATDEPECLLVAVGQVGGVELWVLREPTFARPGELHPLGGRLPVDIADYCSAATGGEYPPAAVAAGRRGGEAVSDAMGLAGETPAPLRSWAIDSPARTPVSLRFDAPAAGRRDLIVVTGDGIARVYTVLVDGPALEPARPASECWREHVAEIVGPTLSADARPASAQTQPTNSEAEQ